MTFPLFRRLVFRPLLSVLVATGALLAYSGVPADASPSVPAIGPNLIVNGCFQVPGLTSGLDNIKGSVASGLQATTGQGLPEITGWTAGGTFGVNVNAADQWQPGGGCNQSVDLAGGGGPGFVSQAVRTTPGDSYLLQWEMSGNPYGPPSVKTMHVLWGGKVVAAPTVDVLGNSGSSMGWVSHQLIVTATVTSSTVEFADASAGDGPYGSLLDGVSLRLATPPETVNGFSATGAQDPYSDAERQMLAKLPQYALIKASGHVVCALKASAAAKVDNGAGLLIVWGVAPTSQFLQEPAAEQQAAGSSFEQYLLNLEKTSKSLYLAALHADRVPLQGSADLAGWWGVEVQSTSTLGKVMAFQIAITGATETISWSNIFGVNFTTEALAPKALANMLYYTRNIAVGPGST